MNFRHLPHLPHLPHFSCQSKTPEQIADEKEQQLIAAKQKAEADLLKDFVDTTPDLYKVNWKVCSDGFQSQH